MSESVSSDNPCEQEDLSPRSANPASTILTTLLYTVARGLRSTRRGIAPLMSSNYNDCQDGTGPQYQGMVPVNQSLGSSISGYPGCAFSQAGRLLIGVDPTAQARQVL